MSLFLMICSSVLGLSGHIHVGIIVLFSTENIVSLFYPVTRPFLTPLSCVVTLCALGNLVSWKIGFFFFLDSRDLLNKPL